MRVLARLACGVLAVLVGLELLLRVLPVSTSTDTGYYLDPLVLTYPPGHEWRVATGWDLRNGQHVRANNAGFVADRSFVRNSAAIALIGDSYVEAAMLDANDRPAAQLEALLQGRRPVFAMGSPGTALLDYAERIRLAYQRYGVRTFVVLMERGDLLQALCGSGNVHAVCLDRNSYVQRVETLPAPSRLKQLLRHSALAQYLVSQLKLDPTQFASRLFPWRRTQHAGSGASPSSDAQPWVGPVTRKFFERVREAAPESRLLILMDADRHQLQTGGPPDPDPGRVIFQDLARGLGAEVVDMEAVVRTHFKQSSRSLDIGPYDAHLNALGVLLYMKAAADQLARQPD